MTVLVLAPHPDDEVLGVGGTLAAYASKGIRTVVVIFSTGAGSHPLHKENVITRRRKEETLAAHKQLNVSETIFLMYDEFNFREELIEKEGIAKLHEIIKKEKPTKIFMPAIDDLHAHHRAVSHLMLQLYSQYELECGLFTYSIWNPVAFLKRSQPRLVVDVSQQHHTKLVALREYRTQWLSLYQTVPVLIVKSFVSGLRYGYRWVEVFIQVK
jgi:N-acetylglucosamine malate deacetylase 1